eukprot:CAMPEP_0119405308 /NCGR_PEP_ID=MMETSP1334-20130426/144327_1 /TAXON_ID=127549 /ORGANISM="Calcidiscus leptoporus, Strain RCC1130" /LENGTH=107 /DNA_ID=CAMNT_0007429279 /DNA_START=735 /DNA_END=1058 /DNA_ORIENTATION=+
MPSGRCKGRPCAARDGLVLALKLRRHGHVGLRHRPLLKQLPDGTKRVAWIMARMSLSTYRPRARVHAAPQLLRPPAQTQDHVFATPQCLLAAAKGAPAQQEMASSLR